MHLHDILIQPSEPSSSPTDDASVAIYRALRTDAQRPTAVGSVVLAVVSAVQFSEYSLHDGLEDWETAASDADVDFDGGPDECAGGGVGAVGEGQGGDGVGADDADATDAGGVSINYS